MMKIRMNNKKVLIIMLILLLLILALGYAVFSEILTISGTANAKGTFDLEFQNAEVVKNVGADKEKTTAEISLDKNTLTVNAADLAYPGAGVEFSVDIVNVGAMPAEVQAVTQNNITGSDKIKVTGLDGIKVGHPKIEVGDRCNIHFTVEWPEDVTDISKDESSINFGLQIEYTQSTEQTEDPLPEYTVPTGITTVYGKTLADIELPAGFKFQDALDTPVGNAGTNSFKVTYTSEDNVEVKDIEVLIEVGKATPKYTLPTGLTAVYGNTLADIKLPEGFKFQDSLETSVGNIGTNKFKVTYTPADINNYNEVTNIEVSIVVSYGTLVSQITGEDYGKSINYVATVKNTKVSNWKVLYNDKSNVYLILDDFLPVSLVPSLTGLVTSGTYSVYSSVDRDTFLQNLTTESYWSAFANGISGATAIGTPRLEMIVSSYNEKHNTNFGATYITIDNTDILYVPYSSEYSGITTYWLADPSPGATNSIWNVRYDGKLVTYGYARTFVAIRPVVKLPTATLGIVGATVEIK